MPQTTNRQLVRDMNNTPMGRGTVYSTLLKISAATRDRARIVNEGEHLRLDKMMRMIDRHRRAQDFAQTRMLKRVEKELQELQAFQIVLRDQYSVQDFRTLQPPPVAMSNRRKKLETMFYHSGFSQKDMQPEIRRQLEKMDPERMRRKWKRHLLERSKQEVGRLADRSKQFSSSLESPTVAISVPKQQDLAGWSKVRFYFQICNLMSTLSRDWFGRRQNYKLEVGVEELVGN